MTPQDREILIESMRNDKNPNPNPPEHATRLLEETCERTGLSWKARHLYLIQRGGKWQVTVSIDGFRLIANQDPEYAGQEGPFWTMGPDQPWTDIPPKQTPYAAKVGVIRNKGGQLVTTWGVAKFDDYNARSPMWTKMGPTMIAKCAEMLGLRKALPGKLGGLYGVEEMEQADAPAKGAAKSGRSSTPFTKLTDKGEDIPPSDGNWEGRIEKCESTEALKALGVEIQQTNMGVTEKLELNKVYLAKKTKLAEEGK